MASAHSFVTNKLHKGSWLMLLEINRGPKRTPDQKNTRRILIYGI
jgi:hypothetical protein